jgi:hypothetical protein
MKLLINSENANRRFSSFQVCSVEYLGSRCQHSAGQVFMITKAKKCSQYVFFLKGCGISFGEKNKKI